MHKLSNVRSKIKSHGRQPRRRFAAKYILTSERPSWYSCDQVFIEAELENLTADGAEVISILRDHEDLLVILAVPAEEETPCAS